MFGGALQLTFVLWVPGQRKCTAFVPWHFQSYNETCSGGISDALGVSRLWGGGVQGVLPSRHTPDSTPSGSSQDPLSIPHNPQHSRPQQQLGEANQHTLPPGIPPPPAPHGPWAHPLPLTAPRTSAAESSSATANQTVRRPTEMAQTRGSHCTITAACRPSGRGLGDQLGYKWGGGDFGKKPWYCILVCRWRRPLADRHSQVGGGGWAQNRS